jgi:hypothetical protein
MMASISFSSSGLVSHKLGGASQKFSKSTGLPEPFAYTLSVCSVAPFEVDSVDWPFGVEDGLEADPEEDCSLARNDWKDSTTSAGAAGCGAGA